MIINFESVPETLLGYISWEEGDELAYFYEQASQGHVFRPRLNRNNTTIIGVGDSSWGVEGIHIEISKSPPDQFEVHCVGGELYICPSNTV